MVGGVDVWDGVRKNFGGEWVWAGRGGFLRGSGVSKFIKLSLIN
jgi:hypothetical protein